MYSHSRGVSVCAAGAWNRNPNVMTKLSGNELAHVLLQLGVLLAIARVLGDAAKRLGQPALLGEMLAGALLGPSVLGQIYPPAAMFLAPAQGGAALFANGLTTLAAALFMLVAGMDVDLSSAWRQGKSVITVSALGLAVPFGLGLLAALEAPTWFGKAPNTDPLVYALFFATALSISALPVIAKTLLDLGLYRSDFGMLVIAAAVVDDLAGWIVFAVVLGMMGGAGAGAFTVGRTVLLTLLFAGGMLTVGRWVIHRALLWLGAQSRSPGGVLSFAVSVALLGAALTEWIGIHAVFGAFMAGVALGDSPQLRKQAREILDQFISYVFAPLFFASIGLRVNFVAHFDLALVSAVLALGCFTKIAACGLGARLSGMPSREAWAVGFGMNARGAMQIMLGVLALEQGVIDDRMFVAIVVMALATTILAGPVIQRLLKPRSLRRAADYLLADACLTALTARSRRDAIAELADAVAKVTGIDARTIERRVWEREELMPTGLGDGVAIPHAHVPGIHTPIIAVGFSPAGVDFDAPDGRRADLVFLAVTPEHDDGAQLDILAEISQWVRNPEVRARRRAGLAFSDLVALLREPGRHNPAR